MIKPIFSLFSSSMIGRVLGLLRFQLMLYLFNQTLFTDNIIYTTTLIWTINNFFIVPIVNKSLISDLNNVSKEEHNVVIRNVLRLIFRAIILTALLAYSISALIIYFNDSILYNNFELLIILIIVTSLGINEVFSLYNQFNDKYFIYAFNRTIWNVIIIIGLYYIYIINNESITYYLVFMLLSILLSLLIQFYISKFRIKDLMFKEKITIQGVQKRNNIWYSALIIIFLGITFIDLNFLKIHTAIGIITTFTILMKLPDLLLSLINSAIQPVYFNSIIKNYSRLKNNLLVFCLIVIILFIILFIITYIFGDNLYLYMFNFIINDYENLSYWVICMVGLNTLSYMLVRLSVDFTYTKNLLIAACFALCIKLTIIINSISIESIITSNIIFHIIIIIFSIVFISKPKLNNKYSA